MLPVMGTPLLHSPGKKSNSGFLNQPHDSLLAFKKNKRKTHTHKTPSETSMQADIWLLPREQIYYQGALAASLLLSEGAVLHHNG